MKAPILVKIGCIVVWITWSVFPRLLHSGELRVSVLDVGQGDSILVECPNGVKILVDGGSGAAVLSELGEAIPPWIRNINILVLTHDHDDHMVGFFDVLDRYKVNEIWVREDECESRACLQMIEFADQNGVRVVDLDEVNSGVNLNVCGVGISVLLYYFNVGGDSVNNSTVVGVFVYGEFSVALMGDLEQEGEELLVEELKEQGLLNISVLKAGHHCSKTATSELFLSYTHPKYALCSVGEGNSFGHPHEETITRFREFEVEYLRTDEKGRIVLKTNGVISRILTER